MYLAVPLSTGREGWPQAGVSPLFEDKMPPPRKTLLKTKILYWLFTKAAVSLLFGGNFPTFMEN